MTASINKGGRPTIFSPQITEEICYRLSEGESLIRICKDEHMPSRRTVIGWLNRNEAEYIQFLRNYARARELQADSFFDEIIEEARNAEPATANAVRVRLDALKWAASKLKPGTYGDRLEMLHNEKVVVHLVDYSSIGQLTDSSVKKIDHRGEGADKKGGKSEPVRNFVFVSHMKIILLTGGAYGSQEKAARRHQPGTTGSTGQGAWRAHGAGL